MKKNIRYIFFILLICFFSCKAKKTNQDSTSEIDYNVDYGKYIVETGKPQEFGRDLVPDEKTAVKLADAIWDARYGTSKQIRDLPYSVILEKNKVWYVKTNLPKGYFGQVLNIKINKYDGRILYIWSEG